MNKRSSGFVLAPVLWILISLAALTSAALHFTQATSSSLQAALDRLKLEDITRSAIAKCLAEIDPAEPKSRGAIEMRLKESMTTISWVSEASRADLNLAPPDVLHALFLASGADPLEARDYTERILQKRARARTVRGGLVLPFSHPAEIMALNLPPRIASRLRELSTVYGVSGRIDPRIAASALVINLPGMSEILLRDLAGATDQDLAGIKMREADGVGRLFEAAAAGAIRLTVDARLENKHRLRSEIVLIRFYDDVEPYRILYWQDAPATEAPLGRRQ